MDNYIITVFAVKKTKRISADKEWADIDKRKAQGERLGDILSDLIV